MFKVNNKNTRTTPVASFVVFVVNFGHISHFVLVLFFGHISKDRPPFSHPRLRVTERVLAR